jgi:hypothetical protein
MQERECIQVHPFAIKREGLFVGVEGTRNFLLNRVPDEERDAWATDILHFCEWCRMLGHTTLCPEDDEREAFARAQAGNERVLTRAALWLEYLAGFGDGAEAARQALKAGAGSDRHAG